MEKIIEWCHESHFFLDFFWYQKIAVVQSYHGSASQVVAVSSEVFAGEVSLYERPLHSRYWTKEVKIWVFWNQIWSSRSVDAKPWLARTYVLQGSRYTDQQYSIIKWQIEARGIYKIILFQNRDAQWWGPKPFFVKSTLEAWGPHIFRNSNYI